VAAIINGRAADKRTWATKKTKSEGKPSAARFPTRQLRAGQPLVVRAGHAQ
jgi:hypothetical protein